MFALPQMNVSRFPPQLPFANPAAALVPLTAAAGRFAAALALATLGFAPLLAAPASAQTSAAREVCAPGGYWYVQKEGRGNALALACPGGASFERVPAPAAASPSAIATNPQDCVPGGYWWMQTEEAAGAGGTAVAMKCR